jgi:PAS domain S-box-containing protein
MTGKGKAQDSPPVTSVSGERAEEVATGLRDELLGALIVTTLDARVLSWNTGAVSLFGYSNDDALGQSLFDLTIPAGERPETERRLRAAAESGFGVFEAARRRRDGSALYVEVTVKAGIRYGRCAARA